MYFSFLKQLTVTHVSWSPSTISSPVMSLIQPVETDCKQFSRAILLTKVFMFGFFKKSYIGVQSLPWPNDPLKVLTWLLDLFGRSCGSSTALWPVPPDPPSIPMARFARLDKEVPSIVWANFMFKLTHASFSNGISGQFSGKPGADFGRKNFM